MARRRSTRTVRKFGMPDDLMTWGAAALTVLVVYAAAKWMGTLAWIDTKIASWSKPGKE